MALKLAKQYNNTVEAKTIVDGLPYNDFQSSQLEYFLFQPEAIKFLLEHKKAIMALPTGSGKTMVAISTFTYIKQQYPNAKCIYVTDKSVVKQTISTICRYFNLSHEYIYENSPIDRERLYKSFTKKKDFLCLNYAMLRQDLEDFEEMFDELDYDDIVLILDEANYIAGKDSKLHNIVKGMCKYLTYVISLTATPSKGKLEEYYNRA